VLAVNFDIGNIVFKHRRNVDLDITVRLCSARTHENNDLGECALRKDDQEAGLHQEVSQNEMKSQLTQYLSTSTIAYDNKFPTNFSHDVK
jgi:hypothetical protein